MAAYFPIFSTAAHDLYRNFPPLSSINRGLDTAGNLIDTAAASYDLGTKIYDRYRLWREREQKKLDNRHRFIIYDNRLLPFSRVESSSRQYQGEDIPSVIRARRYSRKARRRYRRYRDKRYRYY